MCNSHQIYKCWNKMNVFIEKYWENWTNLIWMIDIMYNSDDSDDSCDSQYLWSSDELNDSEWSYDSDIFTNSTRLAASDDSE